MICPVCRRLASTHESNPFCSERCRLVDLGNWIEGTYRMPDDSGSVPDLGEPAPDEETQH